ncbi:hypothetical protein [Flavobacterium polysaccharolyticum]|uniref:Uncharacterized protein n=1 Tax=Flavobacterium polysaccharolyticum TaxID=3133148 RepID=A0ABU9NTH2_9FLAO
MAVKFFNFTAWSKLAIFYEMAPQVIRFIALLRVCASLDFSSAMLFTK